MENNAKKRTTYNIKKDSEMLYHYAALFENGIGEKRCFKTALKYYDEAAELGNADARAMSGKMRYLGQGVNANVISGLTSAINAELNGSPFGNYMLAEFYERGEGYEKDPVRAKINYDKAYAGLLEKAENRDGEAFRCLGNYHYFGLGSTQKDFSKALEFYKKSALLGNIESYFNLGNLYAQGEGVEKNPEKAFCFHMIAAKYDHEVAQNEVGTYFEHGLGVEKDIQSAIKWYKKSSKQGCSIASLNLSRCHKRGIGVPQDDKKALNILKKAIEQHEKEKYRNEVIIYTRTLFYDDGIGFESNEEKANEHYVEAAKLGHEDSKIILKNRKIDWETALKHLVEEWN
ncbi:MAG: hypothetical protein FWE22_02875 [Firmicutes bacterium]|nr:hypothetical protein [Bacillota bacterium]